MYVQYLLVTALFEPEKNRTSCALVNHTCTRTIVCVWHLGVATPTCLWSSPVSHKHQGYKTDVLALCHASSPYVAKDETFVWERWSMSNCHAT